MLTAQCKRSDRQAITRTHAIIRIGDDLRTAAADVHHDAVRIRDALYGADEVIRRLFVPRDDADPHARAARKLLTNSAAVRRCAQCRGRKSMNTADIKSLDVAPESAQNPDRFLNAVTHKPPFFQIRGKPDGIFPLHQEVERTSLDAVNRHAYGIRTDVDDRVQHGHPSLRFP